MENEVVNNKKNNTGIIIAIVVGVLVIAVIAFFLLSGKGKEKPENVSKELDETTLNNVLTYLGIDKDGKPNSFNDDIVIRLYTTAENYNVKEFVNEYASVNNLFEAEEYVNDNEDGCETNNDQDGLTRKCFLLSKDNFNKITSLYNIDYDFDDLDEEYKVNGKYLYKYQLAVSLQFSEYKYIVNSATYEDDDKTKIVLDATRVKIDIETQEQNSENFKFYLTKNGDTILFDKIENANN